MIRLFRGEAWSFLECISKIKSCCSECSEDVSHFFTEFPSDPDDFDCYAMEELSCLPFYKDYDNLYYEENHDEDSEPAGEIWIFSSSDMVEYYKTLDELYKTKRIVKMKYEMELNSMESCIKENICEAGASGSLYCELVYSDAAEDKKDNITVYLDYYVGYYSLFDLYCGLIKIFDKYKVKLQELKDTYFGEENLLEAA